MSQLYMTEQERKEITGERENAEAIEPALDDLVMCDTSSPNYPWPKPKPSDLIADDFNLVWDCIQTWDINVPEVYHGYCEATGNHVMSILFATGKRNITDYT